MPLKTVELPQRDMESKPVVAVVGTFDGVHLGHEQLFKTALGIKRKTGLPVMAVTFTPHPKSLLKLDNGYQTLISPLNEKRVLLAALGVDYFWAICFTKAVSEMEPEEFVLSYLSETAKAQYIVCGFNFRFGYKRQGTAKMLEQIGRQIGIQVSIVPPFMLEGNVVSSTKIRHMLYRGDIEGASRYLGRPYFVNGYVKDKFYDKNDVNIFGANIGFPSDKILPKDGIYAVYVRTPGQELLPGLSKIGASDDISGEDRMLQVYVPNFSSQSEQRSMQVFFMKYIREERGRKCEEFDKGLITTDMENAISLLDSYGSEFPFPDLFTHTRAYDRISYANLP